MSEVLEVVVVLVGFRLRFFFFLVGWVILVGWGFFVDCFLK